MSLRVELTVVAALLLIVGSCAAVVASAPAQPVRELPVVQVGVSPTPTP